jgi:phage terminase large subunit GpA-like protein
VKGASNPATPFIPKRPTRNNKQRCPLFMLGVNAGKSLLYGRLKIIGANDEPCAYKYHFDTGADRDYFDQLTAEKAERKFLGGRWVTVYACPAHKRNEVLDCEVYALAALTLSNVNKTQLGALTGVARSESSAEPQQSAPIVGVQAPKSIIQQPRRGGFVTGWKK